MSLGLVSVKVQANQPLLRVAFDSRGSGLHVVNSVHQREPAMSIAAACGAEGASDRIASSTCPRAVTTAQGAQDGHIRGLIGELFNIRLVYP